mmetsp:Transcript_26820/g.86623  ORF Transcript_26820/g.86623 Transcript_26820/m.86623 type:complete len:565 (-) Transcript_26820:154-1848(-)
MGAVLSRDHELDVQRFDVQAWPRDDMRELRWVVDISRWRPRLAEWNLLLDTLPLSERQAVLSLTAQFDQKRALVSRLMQRRAISHALDVAEPEIETARTIGGKPFAMGVAALPARRPHAPNFNFNVAHDGGVIVLVADPVLLIGVDVAAPFQLRSARLLASAPVSADGSPGANGHVLDGSSRSSGHAGESSCYECGDDYGRVQFAFAHVMTPDEWDAIDAAELGPEPHQPRFTETPSVLPPRPERHPVPEPSSLDISTATDPPAVSGAEHRHAPCGRARDVARLAAFRAQWSRKEAFAKARGDGLALELRRAEFCSTRPPQPPLLPDRASPLSKPEVDVHISPAASSGHGVVFDSPNLTPVPDFVVHTPASPGEPSDACVAVESSSPAILLGSRLVEEADPSFSRLYVDDVLRHDWTCWTHRVCGGYAVSVARGPITDAQDAAGAFVATFGRADVPEDELIARLATPPAPFRLLQLADIVPEQQRTAYAVAADATRPQWTGQVSEFREPAAMHAIPASNRQSEGTRASHAAHLNMSAQAPAWMNPANIRRPANGPAWDDGCCIS